MHFPETHRWELIDGEALVVPSPNTRHQDVAGELHILIGNHLKEHGGGRVFIAPYDVLLSETDVVQPDIVFVSDADAKVITEANVRGTPTWVIEVLSDPTRDRDLKRRLYERAGVPEYWIVDPDGPTIEIHRLRDGRYREPAVLRPGTPAAAAALPGFAVDPGDLATP